MRSRVPPWVGRMALGLAVLAFVLAGVPLGVPHGPPPSSGLMADVPPLTGALYNISFVSSGLPTGTNWSVTLSGSTHTSSARSIGFARVNGTYPFSLGRVPGYVGSPSSGNVTVSGAGVNITVQFTVFDFSVRFDEAGLPTGTRWAVVVSGTQDSGSRARIEVPEPNGTYPYTVPAVSGFTSAPAAGNVTVANDSPRVAITFSPFVYPVRFVETGLAGRNWSVNLSGTVGVTSTSNQTFLEANGSYAFTIGAVPGYLATPASGHARVNGSGITVAITFDPVLYNVTFVENGLSAGTNWSVTLGGATRTGSLPTLVFAEPNGSYPFSVPAVSGWTPVPSSGTVVVSGVDRSVNLTYTASAPGTYPVVFTESGLSVGVAWVVTLNGTPQPSTTTSIVFLEANGSYLYSIPAVHGYSVAPTNGTVDVAGNGTNVPVAFTSLAASTFPVTFSESGLPPGTNWSVTLAGTLFWGTTANLGIDEPNGSYPFTVEPVPGYTASLLSGTVVVAGQPVEENVSFAVTPPAQFPVVFTESGLASGWNWSVTLQGTTQVSNGNQISFSEPAGTYPFTVQADGYTAQPAEGNATVLAGPTSVTLDFSLNAPATHPSSTPRSLSGTTLIFLAAMGLVVVVAVGIALSTSERRGRAG